MGAINRGLAQRVRNNYDADPFNLSTGNANLIEMQRLATAGQGLNSFITRVVRKSYAQKLR